MNLNEGTKNQMHIHLTVCLAHLLLIMYMLGYPFAIARKKLKQRRGFHVQLELKRLTFFIDLHYQFSRSFINLYFLNFL